MELFTFSRDFCAYQVEINKYEESIPSIVNNEFSLDKLFGICKQILNMHLQFFIQICNVLQ